MSMIILPDAVINDIEKMLNSFWWGGGNNSKGIRWRSWEKLACAKNEGGLGFRNFRAFNIAMVEKQGGFLMTNPQALVPRIFKVKYFSKTSFFNASLG